MTKKTVRLSSSVCVLYCVFFFQYYVYVTDTYLMTLKFSGFWIMEKGRETNQITVKILSEEMHISLGIPSFLERNKLQGSCCCHCWIKVMFRAPLAAVPF